MIIIRGSNHYPQDIERSVESAQPLLRAGCTAAFSCTGAPGNGECLVFVAEVRETVTASQMDEICNLCRSTVVNEHGVSLSSICLLKPRTIPKTTSGKIARSWCRRAYMSDPIGLDVLYRWDAPADSGIHGSRNGEAVPTVNDNVTSIEMNGSKPEVYSRVPAEEEIGAIRDAEEIREMPLAELLQELEVILCDIVSRVGGELKPPVDTQKPLVLLGMDSMSVIQFKGVLDNRYKCNIPDEYMFTKLATLDTLVKAVHHGGLTEEQLNAFAAEEAPRGADTASGDEQTVPVVNRSEPCCPWFTCCY